MKDLKRKWKQISALMLAAVLIWTSIDMTAFAAGQYMTEYEDADGYDIYEVSDVSGNELETVNETTEEPSEDETNDSSVVETDETTDEQEGELEEEQQIIDVQSQTTEGFTVTGGISDTDYSYADGVLTTKMKEGTAVIDIEGQLRGLATQENKIITTDKINDLCGRLIESHYNIYELRLKSNKKYPSHLRIAGFRIRTTMGTIGIRLFDETSEYRDNFIKLVCENFYDSLLVHRVLPNYLIQMGAADTRYAKKDDVVGWQGPGYTLPMDIHKHLFHKRGMVAASKLPEDHNKSNRCDGSQFFIVAGRRFTEIDLESIEKEYGKKFSLEQKQAYTTVGGAPYLDGDYTVFAEVTEGMAVVDKIASVPLNGDRPKEDIRIKDVEIVWR